MRAVYVPPGTNEGSAFARHVVLIWTVGDHTYGVGFHDIHGLQQTLALDVALARAVRLVAPEGPVRAAALTTAGDGGRSGALAAGKL